MASLRGNRRRPSLTEDSPDLFITPRTSPLRRRSGLRARRSQQLVAEEVLPPPEELRRNSQPPLMGQPMEEFDTRRRSASDETKSKWVRRRFRKHGQHFDSADYQLRNAAERMASSGIYERAQKMKEAGANIDPVMIGETMGIGSDGDLYLGAEAPPVLESRGFALMPKPRSASTPSLAGKTPSASAIHAHRRLSSLVRQQVRRFDSAEHFMNLYREKSDRKTAAFSSSAGEGSETGGSDAESNFEEEEEEVVPYSESSSLYTGPSESLMRSSFAEVDPVEDTVLREADS